MSLINTALIGLTAVTIALLFSGTSAAKLDQLVSPNCLGCLCEASTQCNVTVACHVPFAGAYYCGPFLISWAYWADAGKPVIKGDDPGRQGAFENCANDLYCAAQTVRGYMQKFSKDCNDDGKVSCTDYVLIHKFGPQNCGAHLRDRFGQLYEECRSTLFLQ